MKYIFIALALLPSLSQAEVPVGRFGQDGTRGSYRDVVIEKEGKTAVWLKANCRQCPYTISRRALVAEQEPGILKIGGAYFEVVRSDGKIVLKNPGVGQLQSR